MSFAASGKLSRTSVHCFLRKIRLFAAEGRGIDATLRSASESGDTPPNSRDMIPGPHHAEFGDTPCPQANSGDTPTFVRGSNSVTEKREPRGSNSWPVANTPRYREGKSPGMRVPGCLKSPAESRNLQTAKQNSDHFCRTTPSRCRGTGHTGRQISICFSPNSPGPLRLRMQSSPASSGFASLTASFDNVRRCQIVLWRHSGRRNASTTRNCRNRVQRPCRLADRLASFDRPHADS